MTKEGRVTLKKFKPIWPQIRGPFLTFCLCLFIETLKRVELATVPNPPALLILTIVYATFTGGTVSGLISGALGWFYIAFYFSNPEGPFQYSDENLLRVPIWAASIILIVAMVGLLKRRAAQALIAEAASRSKSAFLANVSHEIRTPLGAVLGFSELLANEDLAPEKKATYANIIKRNGQLLSEIINDILDLSKIEEGKLKIERTLVNVPEVLTDVVNVIEPMAQKKGLQFSVQKDPYLRMQIETDPHRLRQILLNLIGNAIKFTEKGHVRLAVSTLREGNKDLLAFTIEDTGIGIDTATSANLFHPFTQADETATRKFGGAGLGLALSKKLAQLLGGDVRLLQSAIGRGSTFILTIDPGAPAVPKASESERAEFAKANGSEPLHGLHVLLAEDSADNQILVTHLLNSAGARVTTASNGREAVDLAGADHFDVILMDLQMPVMNGYESYKELRRRGCKCPIVALTAHALHEDQKHSLEMGFDAHICKPIDRHQLISEIKALAT